jgi:phosphate transport system permease protein
MSLSAIVALLLLLLIAVGFYLGRWRALADSNGSAAELHSLPNYYGYYIAVWTGLPAFLLLALYGIFSGPLTTGAAIAELERAATGLAGRYERVLDADREHAAARAEQAEAAVELDALNAEIEALRAASGEARDPQRFAAAEAERLAAVDRFSAAVRAAEARAETLRADLIASAPDDPAGLRARAGFEYVSGSQVERERFLTDALALSADRLPSRETPQVLAAAGMIDPIKARFETIAAVSVIALALGGLGFTRRQIQRNFRARARVEAVSTAVLWLCSIVAILTTVGIVLSLLFETLRFFGEVSVLEFIFGLHWSPQTAIRADQVGQSGAFGAVPLFAGTALITVIAMLVAAPVGLFSAIYLAEYAGPSVRRYAKPILEVLAGVPTVVYGYFAITAVGPVIRAGASWLGFEEPATKSALAAGLVMGVMIIPFVSSLADDVIRAVPRSLRDGAYAMGATRSEAITSVVLPAALPGLVGAVLLAVSRAIGETMIVLMAAGQAANLTANPLDSVTTITVWIVTLLVGDFEFDTAKTLSAFALGLLLFTVTLALNVIALRVVQKYRDRYE